MSDGPFLAKWYVVRGIPESLGCVPGHTAVQGIERFQLLDGSFLGGAFPHCAVHIISERFMPEAAWHYTQPHVHDTDEVNLILSPNGCLRYRYEIDGSMEIVDSPSCVFIPAGTPHRMEAAGGTGIFICIHLSARRE